MSKHGYNNSAVIVARLLSTEGFTDYTANQVEKYWRKNSGLSEKQIKKLSELDKVITEISSKLSISERLSLGRFIGLHKKMSFDVGLKIGITAFAQQNNKGISSKG